MNTAILQRVRFITGPILKNLSSLARGGGGGYFCSFKARPIFCFYNPRDVWWTYYICGQSTPTFTWKYNRMMFSVHLFRVVIGKSIYVFSLQIVNDILHMYSSITWICSSSRLDTYQLHVILVIVSMDWLIWKTGRSAKSITERIQANVPICLGPLLQTLSNFNQSMDEWLHPF